MLTRLLRTKSLEQLQANADEPEHQLKKNLTAFDLTMFGIGAIIGAGIFSSIGTAAAGHMADGRLPAGPGLVISILIVALICGFTGLAYAEMASMIPVSGSAYTYAYATLGEVMAWIIGWDLLLEYAISNVAVAISWGDYARSFLSSVFHVNIPAWLGMDPRTALKLVDGVHPMALGEKLQALAGAKAGLVQGASVFVNWDTIRTAPVVAGFPITFNLLAVIITTLITWLCYIGIKESARVNGVMVVIKVFILLAVVGLGVRFIDPGNWHPFVPHGWPGIQAGAAIIFFAFIGFDAVSTTAEECKDPGRDLPRGILGSLLICTVIYAAVALVVTGMLHYTKLGGIADPLAYIFSEHHMNGIAGVISFGAVIATTAALLVYQLGQPRIIMSMSRDGLLGAWFSKVHPTFKTPSHATILTGFLVAIPAALLSIDEVVELANIGTLFAFSIVCAAVLILRKRRPDAPRKFRMPLPWVIAPLGILGCIWIAKGLPLLTWYRFFIWLGIGLVIYAAFGSRNSRLENPAA
jgi:APA family basic amino acid/polyamine antiporter